MVIVKEVKLVSNVFRKNVVVQYLESVPTVNNPIVLQAQRVSKLTFEEALKDVGTGLIGVIIKAPCRHYQYMMEGRTDPHEWTGSHSRYMYVEQGDDVTDLLGPMLSDDDTGAYSNSSGIF